MKPVDIKSQSQIVGQSDPDIPSTKFLQGIFRESREVSRTSTCGCPADLALKKQVTWDVSYVRPPGPRKDPPPTNPHVVGNTCFIGACYGCDEETCPPETILVHYVNGPRDMETKRYYHPRCWDRVYTKCKQTGDLDSLNLWGSPMELQKLLKFPPPKPAAKRTKPALKANQVRSAVVPDKAEEHVKISRRMTIPLLESLDVKLYGGPPKLHLTGRARKREMKRLYDQKPIRDYCQKQGCGRPTIAGAVREMERRDREKHPPSPPEESPSMTT